MQNNRLNIRFNEKTTLTGIYARSTMSERGLKVNNGHYKIVVNNSLEVNLLPPYLTESVRPKEEVQRFEGKKVVVTGIIIENTAFSPPSLEVQPLSVNIPCFITIESIRLAKD